jgi:SAM-dependent methyltransferase
VEPGAPALVKLDIGCGKNKKAGFLGIDSLPLDGVDVVMDVTLSPLPYGDGTVAEIHSSHFLEHLTARQRVRFMNECWRVLRKDGQMTLIVPHWGSCRAYGDMTHQWPPVSEFWFYYLDKGWRAQNAPHDDSEHSPDGYCCDFNAVWGYSANPGLNGRNAEYVQFAYQWYKEAIQDIHATLTARK